MLLSPQKIKEVYIQWIKEASINSKPLFPRPKEIKYSVRNVLEWQNLFLFIRNHPNNNDILNWAEIQLVQLTKWCKVNKRLLSEKKYNSGLPYISMYSYFTYTLCQWLTENEIIPELDNYPEDEHGFNDFLRLTLPSYVKEKCQLDLTNAEWIKYLKIRDNEKLGFIMDQFSKLNFDSTLRDVLFERQKLSIKVLPKKGRISTAWNKIQLSEIYYHTDWFKKLNTFDWIKIPIPSEAKLNQNDRAEILSTSKIKLLLLQRETDPVTYMDLSTIRMFELERGIRIALFTMVPDKQLPYESYVGYTLYKNGYPAAYGGAWICGQHALIGLNIFEWCRGGESALFFNNLLRVYHQIFEIQQFEVEPYQFGLDNPEGISSGAFWFYYRMGFKPVDKKLESLAHVEFSKLQKDKNYRSSSKTLIQFTQSNVILKLNKRHLLTSEKIKADIETFVFKKFKNKMSKAEQHALQQLKDVFISIDSESGITDSVITDYGLLALCYNIKDFELLKKLIHFRISNVYEYQKIWREIFNEESS